jgi:hypothetical protein
MPLVRDFRKYTFTSLRVDRCGRNVATKAYWKLYAIENTIRVVVNSVLLRQIGAEWWSIAVDPTVAREAHRQRNRSVANPKHANPGSHDIYLISLFHLTEILRTNSNLFEPVIPETNQLLVALELMRGSRNLVGHMNFPNAYDRDMVDIAYKQLPTILARLAASNVPITIP